MYRLREKPTKSSCNTNDKLKARITVGFTNLNQNTSGKAFRMISMSPGGCN